MILFPTDQTMGWYETEKSPQWYHEGVWGVPVFKGNSSNIFRAVKFSKLIQFDRIHLFSLQLECWPYICDKENTILNFLTNLDQGVSTFYAKIEFLVKVIKNICFEVSIKNMMLLAEFPLTFLYEFSVYANLMQNAARTKSELLPTKTAEFHTALNILQGLKLCLLSFERTVRILLTVCLTSACNLEGLLSGIPVTFHFTFSLNYLGRIKCAKNRRRISVYVKNGITCFQVTEKLEKKFLNAYKSMS